MSAPVIAMIGMPGWPELTLIIVVLVMIFGPSRLPKLAEGIADAVKSIRGIADESDRKGD